ncbi:hypothetical protein KC356_g122 [Hortaea werneckii]|nr:hypothetical protein KC356_g122 [Hortaea werneckii]
MSVPPFVSPFVSRSFLHSVRRCRSLVGAIHELPEEAVFKPTNSVKCFPQSAGLVHVNVGGVLRSSLGEILSFSHILDACHEHSSLLSIWLIVDIERVALPLHLQRFRGVIKSLYRRTVQRACALVAVDAAAVVEKRGRETLRPFAPSVSAYAVLCFRSRFRFYDACWFVPSVQTSNCCRNLELPSAWARGSTRDQGNDPMASQDLNLRSGVVLGDIGGDSVWKGASWGTPEVTVSNDRPWLFAGWVVMRFKTSSQGYLKSSGAQQKWRASRMKADGVGMRASQASQRRSGRLSWALRSRERQNPDETSASHCDDWSCWR